MAAVITDSHSVYPNFWIGSIRAITIDYRPTNLTPTSYSILANSYLSSIGVCNVNQHFTFFVFNYTRHHGVIEDIFQYLTLDQLKLNIFSFDFHRLIIKNRQVDSTNDVIFYLFSSYFDEPKHRLMHIIISSCIRAR
jgi:hypothetical protein